MWPTGLPDAVLVGERFSFNCVADLRSPTWGAWRLTFRVRLIEQELFIADLAIDPVAGTGTWPADKVTRTLLGAIPVDGLLEVVQLWMTTDGRPRSRDEAQGAAMEGSLAWAAWEVERSSFIAQLLTSRTGSRGRPLSRSDNELRAIAEDAVEIGRVRNRGWLQELARRRGELGNDGITVSQPLRNAIKACRERAQYLAPTTQGSQKPPIPGAALMAIWARSNDKRYREWTERLLTMDEKGAAK